MEPETEWQIQNGVHAYVDHWEKNELQLDHWLPEGNSLSVLISEVQMRFLAAKKLNFRNDQTLGAVIWPIVSNNDPLKKIESWKSN